MTVLNGFICMPGSKLFKNSEISYTIKKDIKTPSTSDNPNYRKLDYLTVENGR